jgi:ABC-2 type transport system permease protein
MSWQAIAKKDIQDSIRSRGLWGLIALFLVLIGLLTWLTMPDNLSSEDSFLAAAGLTFILGLLFFVPLSGLFLSVKSIVRERESGTINLLLSLPHSRSDMVIGKFLGRSTVMTVTVLAGFLPSLLFILIQVDEAAITDVLSFMVAVVLFGIMFVGIGVGFSALVNSETQATIAGVGLFFLLFLWLPIINNLGLDLPTFFERFYLLFMFADMLTVLTEGGLTEPSVVKIGDGVFQSGTGTTESVAPHLQGWFAFVILALWILVPLAVGYYRFNTTDL